MKKLLLFILATAIIVASYAQRQNNNNEGATDSVEGSMSATIEQEQSKKTTYIPKYKSIKEVLDACGVDSFWVRYYPIIIHVNSKECYITPKIGETTLVINPFPFVEYLVENQTKNPPFVTQKDLGEIIVFHDGGEIWISTFKKGKSDLELIVPADTTECYVQTFSPGFEKFYRLLKIYHSNYLTQKKYYEEHHKFIEE